MLVWTKSFSLLTPFSTFSQVSDLVLEFLSFYLSLAFFFMSILWLWTSHHRDFRCLWNAKGGAFPPSRCLSPDLFLFLLSGPETQLPSLQPGFLSSAGDGPFWCSDPSLSFPLPECPTPGRLCHTPPPFFLQFFFHVRVFSSFSLELLSRPAFNAKGDDLLSPFPNLLAYLSFCNFFLRRFPSGCHPESLWSLSVPTPLCGVGQSWIFFLTFVLFS